MKDDDSSDTILNTEEQLEEIKKNIQLDINKLLYKKNKAEIKAYHQVQKKEDKTIEKEIEEKRDKGISSQHHAAA